MFLTCPSLYNLWKLIFDTVTEMIGLPIDHVVLQHKTCDSSYTCKISITCQKVNIALNGKTLSPTVLHWIQEIMPYLIVFQFKMLSSRVFPGILCNLATFLVVCGKIQTQNVFFVVFVQCNLYFV